MLPDMSDVLLEWEQPILLKTKTTASVDFVETEIVTVETVQAVVQPADKTKLKLDSLDWAKEYVLIHSRKTDMAAGQFIEWQGRDFKIVGPNGNYSDYGYVELVGEATNAPALVAT